jgi:hypothetical protein
MHVRVMSLGSGVLGTCGSASLTQTFSTDWALENWAPALPIRPKSGNPGYLVGLPVLSGVKVLLDPTVVGTPEAIEQDIGGLTLLPATDGQQSLVAAVHQLVISAAELCLFLCFAILFSPSP